MSSHITIKDLKDKIEYDVIFRLEESDKKIRSLEDKVEYNVIYRIEELNKVIENLEIKLNGYRNLLDEVMVQNMLIQKKYQNIIKNLTPDGSEVQTENDESKNNDCEYW